MGRLYQKGSWEAKAELLTGGRQMGSEQRLRLAEADRILLEQVDRFDIAIRRIADLETWRQQEGPPPEYWWWNLDVLAQVPPWPVRDRSEVTA
jgi:hypothetical protein